MVTYIFYDFYIKNCRYAFRNRKFCINLDFQKKYIFEDQFLDYIILGSFKFYKYILIKIVYIDKKNNLKTWYVSFIN